MIKGGSTMHTQNVNDAYPVNQGDGIIKKNLKQTHYMG
jgi:hypothetical protein